MFISLPEDFLIKSIIDILVLGYLSCANRWIFHYPNGSILLVCSRGRLNVFSLITSAKKATCSFQLLVASAFDLL